MTSNEPYDRWEVLLAEYRSSTLGPEWLGELQRAVSLTITRYPPAVYAEGGTWTTESRLDLTQDVIARQLLGAGQLAYIVHIARDLDQARALLGRVVRRTLATRRTRTIVDNLLARCREIEPSIVDASGPDATEGDLRALASAVSRMPRVAVRGGDRAPQVFTTDTLVAVLAAIRQRLGHPPTQRDIARIFEASLTDLLPGALVIYDGLYDEPDPSLDPEQEVVMREAVDQAFATLDVTARAVMGLKLASWSDTAIGERLGASRPTVAKVREDASRNIRSFAQSLPSASQDRFVEALASRLLAEVQHHIDLS